MKIVSVFGSSVEKLNILGMIALDLYITVLPFNHMVAHKDKTSVQPRGCPGLGVSQRSVLAV